MKKGSFNTRALVGQQFRAGHKNCHGIPACRLAQAIQQGGRSHLHHKGVAGVLLVEQGKLIWERWQSSRWDLRHNNLSIAAIDYATSTVARNARFGSGAHQCTVIAEGADHTCGYYC